MSRPQWWLSALDLDLLALCEYLADKSSNGLADFLEDFTPPHGALDMQRLVETAMAEHYVFSVPKQRSFGHAFAPVQIAPSGTRRINTVYEHRSRSEERTRAARQGLLLWAYEHEPVSPEGILDAHPPYNFWGTPFTHTDLERAATYLLEGGFIQSMGPLRADGQPSVIRLTNSGKDCVEGFGGNIGSYRANQRNSGGDTFAQHFHGDFTGQNAQGHNISQTQHNASVDPDAFAAIFSGLRDVLAQVDNQDDRDDLATAIADLEAAATRAEPHPGEIQRRAGMLTRLAGRVGNTAMTTATTAATTGLLDLLGGAIT
jgi:hypothetical protein